LIFTPPHFSDNSQAADFLIQQILTMDSKYSNTDIKKYTIKRADLRERKLKNDINNVDSVRRLQFEGDYIQAIMEAKIELIEAEFEKLDKLEKELSEDDDYLVQIQNRISELISKQNS